MKGSYVAWHRDNEGLFGLRGDSKLIVSLILGFSAEFKWKPQSCSSGQAGSCWLHHGDLLVMAAAAAFWRTWLSAGHPRVHRVHLSYRLSPGFVGGRFFCGACFSVDFGNCLLVCWQQGLSVTRGMVG